MNKKVLNSIRESRLLAVLSDLVSFDTHENETPLAQYVVNYLRNLGFQADLHEVLSGRCNAIGILEGVNDGPTLLFNTHLDVVPPGSGWKSAPFNLTVNDGWAYGRGACDAKGCLASMLVAIEAIRIAGVRLKGNLIVAGVIGEEAWSCGSRHLVKNTKADMAIVGEPGISNRIGVAHRGSLRPVLEVHGKSSHSGYPERGINAIEQMGLIVSSLPMYHQKLRDKSHPFCGSPSVTSTIVKGGVKENVVPDYCEVVIDRRLIPGENEETAIQELKDFIGTIGGLKARTEINRCLPTTGGASEIAVDEPIVKIVKEAVMAVLNTKAELYGRKGACDMVHLVSAGIPTVIYGPGDPSTAHQINECIEVSELVRGAKVYASVLLNALG